MEELEYFAKTVEKFFGYGHLPEELQKVSKPFYDVATQMLDHLQTDLEPENVAQFEMGVQHLLAAKDAFVRVKV
jgi:hypothetical protein